MHVLNTGFSVLSAFLIWTFEYFLADTPAD